METARLLNTWDTSAGNWVLGLQVQGDGFVSSNSNGSLDFYNLNRPLSVNSIAAHESSINAVKLISESLLASCSTDGIKVWDVRSNGLVHSLQNAKLSNFLSLGCQSDFVAGGSELIGSDAELHIWDLENPAEPVKSYVDSHHDDITAIQFHPTLSQYLMSGSTDGYVNIYDLNEEDEDDSLHQVINYLSVHSCLFISRDRISILSHMETLSFNQLNNTNYEVWEEPAPRDFGDVRDLWKCEYVVDLSSSGYVTYGSNSEGVLNLSAFNPCKEVFDEKRILFPRAHGEEVVRDFVVLDGGKIALSCGEDGSIKLWELPYQLKLYNFDEVETKINKKQKKHKEKKEGKDKKDKRKSKKDKKDVKYKPY